MTDNDSPPPPHSSREEISREEENEIEDVNDDGNPTSNLDHSPLIPPIESDLRQQENYVNTEDDDGNLIANQPSYLTRFSTFLENSKTNLISFYHEYWENFYILRDESLPFLISFYQESQREYKLFIKDCSKWGWRDQLNPREKHPINWKLPRIPCPRAVLFSEEKRTNKPVSTAPMEKQPVVSPPEEPETVVRSEAIVPITSTSSVYSILAFVAKVDVMMDGLTTIIPEDSELRGGVFRECTPCLQSAASEAAIEETAIAAALESIIAKLAVEDATEMDETEAAAVAVIESVVATVAPQDTMAVEEPTADPTDEQPTILAIEETIDATAAAVALEAVVSAVYDQDSTAPEETSPDSAAPSQLQPLIEAFEEMTIGDERRAAADAAEVEGPIDEAAMIEALPAPIEEDVVEIASDEDTVSVESVVVPPQVKYGYRRELSIVCRQYTDMIQAKAVEEQMKELLYETLDNCEGEDCEIRAQTVACNGQCRTRRNAEDG